LEFDFNLVHPGVILPATKRYVRDVTSNHHAVNLLLAGSGSGNGQQHDEDVKYVMRV
jgi:hypothetical protein